MSDLNGKRILIFVGDDYEDLELQYPKYRLLEAGAEVVVAGVEAGKVHQGKHGYPQKATAAVRDLSASDFHGLVIPGGWMPDKLRRYDEVKDITREIHEAGKCVASICHGPWIDISSGIVEGATYTSTPALTDDLRNAGAKWVDQEVCVDGNHVTSRRPDDLPAFCRAMLEVMGA
ncbi:type 1 glutamine amidotransferase domain-containing protein [Phycisphaerales bacterium AB-hyl4]|uniref:Type 1 glutamine amidotransferase domain-containing protein n=1 Tax=Natronomicrosphaera hydrolytica TaxID=3242702 RepID=A0ABV4U2H8_9BACT